MSLFAEKIVGSLKQIVSTVFNSCLIRTCVGKIQMCVTSISTKLATINGDQSMELRISCVYIGYQF